jgi:hypothetical protein
LRPSQRARLERLERTLGTTLRCSACTTNPIRLAYPGQEAEERCATCGHELLVVRLVFDPGRRTDEVGAVT